MIRFDLLFGGSMGEWALMEANPTGLVAVACHERFNVNLMNAWPDPARVAVMVHYPVIVRKPFLNRYEKVYNLHPGYLPWGRGMYPMVWAMLHQEPCGPTLHEVTERLDEGAIVDQRQVEIYRTDTAADVQVRVREAEKAIFRDLLAKLKRGEIPTGRDPAHRGSYHDLAAFKEARTSSHLPDRTVDFLRYVRAFTNPPHEGMVVSLEDPADPTGRPRRFEVVLKPLD